MYDPQQAMSDLEAEIEALAHAAERCRKIIVLSKVVTGAGSLLLVLTVSGLIQGGPVSLVLAITAVLGGIALFGSNTSTRDQIVECHTYNRNMAGHRICGPRFAGLFPGLLDVSDRGLRDRRSIRPRDRLHHAAARNWAHMWTVPRTGVARLDTFKPNVQKLSCR
jgi:hypothetical protein